MLAVDGSSSGLKVGAVHAEPQIWEASLADPGHGSAGHGRGRRAVDGEVNGQLAAHGRDLGLGRHHPVHRDVLEMADDGLTGGSQPALVGGPRSSPP